MIGHARLTTHGGKLSEPETPTIPDATTGRTHSHRRKSDSRVRFILLKNDEGEDVASTHRRDDSKEQEDGRKTQHETQNFFYVGRLCRFYFYRLPFARRRCNHGISPVTKGASAPPEALTRVSW